MKYGFTKYLKQVEQIETDLWAKGVDFPLYMGSIAQVVEHLEAAKGRLQGLADLDLDFIQIPPNRNP